MDITFQELLDQLPAGSINEVGGKVSINVSLVTGNTADGLTSETVGEFLTKMLLAANAAQTAYNADPANTVTLSGYGARTMGTATLDPNDGQYYVRSTQSLVTRIPLSADTVVGA